MIIILISRAAAQPDHYGTTSCTGVIGAFVAAVTVNKVAGINPYLLGTIVVGAADGAYWERDFGRLCWGDFLDSSTTWFCETVSACQSRRQPKCSSMPYISTRIEPFHGMLQIPVYAVKVPRWDKHVGLRILVDAKGTLQ